MKAVIYARYSAGRNQTDQSIEGQVRVCTSYCAQHGLEVVSIYADHHISGKTDDRPEFQRLISDSKKGLFDAVVVYKTDRLSRDKYDAVIYKRELKRAGIQIHYAAEAIPEGPEGIILESLMEGLAEYYSAELAQKIKRGMYESALKCRVIGKCMPLGYKAGPDKTYVIDEQGAEAVRIIFNMYIEGKTQTEIVNYLNEKGYRTSRGQEFNKNSIPRIIQSEKYIGIYSAAGVTIEGGMPAIIDKETFLLANHKRTEAANRRVNKPVNANYLLSGKMFCSYCKKPMVGVSGTSKTGVKHFYYYCPTARKKHTCEKVHIKKDDLEQLITDLTIKYVLQSDILETCVDRMLEIQAQDDDRELRIKNLNKLLNENKKAQNGLLGALEKGLGTDSILRRLDELEKERLKYESDLAYQKTKTFGLTREQMLFFLERFIDDDSDEEAYREKIISTFVNSVLISNDKIEIFYNMQDENENDRALEHSLSSVRPGASKVDLTSPLVELFILNTSLLLVYNASVANVAK